MADRLTALASGVSIQAIRSGALASRDWQAISEARERLYRLRVVAHDRSDDLPVAAGHSVDDVVLIDGGTVELFRRARALADPDGMQGLAVVIAHASDEPGAADPAGRCVAADVSISLSVPEQRDTAVTAIELAITRNRFGPMGACKVVIHPATLRVIALSDRAGPLSTDTAE
jgi:hypothetical protein